MRLAANNAIYPTTLTQSMGGRSNGILGEHHAREGYTVTVNTSYILSTEGHLKLKKVRMT
jgi:hypothetical protein